MAYNDCGCGMTENMSYEELIALAAKGTCTSLNRAPHQGWVCTNFLSELEHAARDKRSREYRKKKLMRDGYSETEAEKTVKPRNKKRSPSKKMSIQKGSLADL